MEKRILSEPGIAKALSKQIAKSIDEWCVETFNDGHRRHLGASLIGHECSRYLWYTFRWVKAPDFDGRMYRLFQRGHLEENRFIEYLEGIGCTVWADDLENNVLCFNTNDDKFELHSVEEFESNNKAFVEKLNPEDERFKIWIKQAKAEGVEFPQYRISDVFGHFGGSLDGIVKLPPEWGIDEPLLLEFKTSATSAPFTNTVKKGMKVEKAQHYAQTCTYGAKYGLTHVLYMMANKNDDSLHIEVEALDHNHGNQMVQKAQKIITSQEPPPKVSQSKTYMKCSWCDFKKICHDNGIAEKNCRSCKHAVPGENKAWLCSLNGNAAIPDDFIPKGCDHHKSITLIES